MWSHCSPVVGSMLDNVGCTRHRFEQAEIDWQYSNAAHSTTDTESRTHLSMLSLSMCFGLQTFFLALKSHWTTVVCARQSLLIAKHCIYCLQVVQEFVGFSTRPWARCVYLVACVFSCGLLWLLPHYIPQTRLWMMYQCPLSKAQYIQAKVFVC